MRLSRVLAERKKRSGAAGAGAGAETETTTPSSFFLAMAPEIRIQVYELLEQMADHDGDQDRDRAQHYNGFSKTRKSLLLTCRQINQEFTPYFYRSTTFCLRFMNHSPRDFYALLSSMDAVKVQNLRHVEYRNRQYIPSDFAVLEDMAARLARAGVHLATFNVVHGDYLSTSILRAPLALAVLLIDRNRNRNRNGTGTQNRNRTRDRTRAVPSPNMNWTTFDRADWPAVVRHSYGTQFTLFEHAVLARLMPDAVVRRERGPSACGFRVLFRRPAALVDFLANNPPVAPAVQYVDEGPTLAGVLWPLVPPRRGPDGKPIPRRRIRLD
ncbi:hypothetical protein A1O3_01885 [Capronia epimyces CBS 606.96]|uniref:F-box domain-containing protein n=1 Tax=Capronia epimyces CBS 606.96 TaxID=1182542 RepID=W9YHT0_9EURO|nr:uncharacterized protein A1O3_01885 [Capronia epimyces CBS 606.96]EXJ88821.1 hypothetical protein A1O3_01885 [Capronia epimyces CBS 606.96]